MGIVFFVRIVFESFCAECVVECRENTSLLAYGEAIRF